MQERRRLKRRHLIYYLRVFDLQSGALLGHLADVTTAGIMLLCENPVPLDRTYSCRMVCPAGGDDQREVTFDAHSVWYRKDVNPSLYAEGFSLESPDRQTVETIEQLIAEYGFHD